MKKFLSTLALVALLAIPVSVALVLSPVFLPILPPASLARYAATLGVVPEIEAHDTLMAPAVGRDTGSTNDEGDADAALEDGAFAAGQPAGTTPPATTAAFSTATGIAAVVGHVDDVGVVREAKLVDFS